MTFQSFTGREYLKIDIANNYGLDKLEWNERIAWFDLNEKNLNNLQKTAEQPALFYAARQAWEAAKAGRPSGYPISLDATCSGIQILAALAGDRKAALLCNLIDTGRREGAYTGIYEAMLSELNQDTMQRSKDKSGLQLIPAGANPTPEEIKFAEEYNRPKITRDMTKKAIMTAFYSSTAMPKRVFGEGALLDTFYKTLKENAPGAWEINETMRAIWDDKAYSNDWVMPDNFHVHIKIMGREKETVHFLNQPVEVTYSINKPISNGRSLGANLTHSVDGMVVREMARRCMYDPQRITYLTHLLNKNCTYGSSVKSPNGQMVAILYGQYLESGFLSARILDYLEPENLALVDERVIIKLINSLPQKPFEVISVHDCFRCLPNHGNDLRRQYNEILACIAESRMLGFLVSQIMGRKIDVTPSDQIGSLIREANYALS